MMHNSIEELVHRFFDKAWNRQQLETLDMILHSAYIDHSLPAAYPATKEGLKMWIKKIRGFFNYHTIIERLVAEDDLVTVKIRMNLLHYEPWQKEYIAKIELSPVGIQFFKIAGNKIKERWVLEDINTIENIAHTSNLTNNVTHYPVEQPKKH